MSLPERPLVARRPGFLPFYLDDVFEHVLVPITKKMCLTTEIVFKLHAGSKRLDAMKRHAFHVLVVKVQMGQPPTCYTEA